MKKIIFLFVLLLAITMSFAQTDLHIILDYDITPCDTLPRQVTLEIVDSNDLCIPPFYILINATDTFFYSGPIVLSLDTGWHSIRVECWGHSHLFDFFIHCGYAFVQHYGIDDNVFLIYPNPSNDNITIENTSKIENYFISIYNNQGQLQLQQKINQSKTMLDISTLTKGVYLIKLISAEKTEMKKFVKH